MKTTLDLPDDLLIEAKAVAARRRTTLKEMVTRSLRREIGQLENAETPARGPFAKGINGLPVIGKPDQADSKLYETLARGDVEDVIAYLDGLDRVKP